jgi:cobalamin biosynthesis protein CbiD
MIEAIQEQLDQAFYPADLVKKLTEAKTDEEMLKIARDIVSYIKAAEEISFRISKVLYAEKNNK